MGASCRRAAAWLPGGVMCYWDKTSFCDGKSPPDYQAWAWLLDSVAITAMVQGFGWLQTHTDASRDSLKCPKRLNLCSRQDL